MVCRTNPLIAAHLFPVSWFVSNEDSALSFALLNCIIWAMFLLNRSFSIVINVSFFFKAPGLLFKLLCLILASPIIVSQSLSSDASGKAPASDSRFVINFLEGRLRFLDEGFDFSIREINAECLIMRLSLFVVVKALLASRRSIECREVVGEGLGVRGC